MDVRAGGLPGRACRLAALVAENRRVRSPGVLRPRAARSPGGAASVLRHLANLPHAAGLAERRESAGAPPDRRRSRRVSGRPGPLRRSRGHNWGQMRYLVAVMSAGGVEAAANRPRDGRNWGQMRYLVAVVSAVGVEPAANRPRDGHNRGQMRYLVAVVSAGGFRRRDPLRPAICPALLGGRAPRRRLRSAPRFPAVGRQDIGARLRRESLHGSGRLVSPGRSAPGSTTRPSPPRPARQRAPRPLAPSWSRLRAPPTTNGATLRRPLTTRSEFRCAR